MCSKKKKKKRQRESQLWIRSLSNDRMTFVVKKRNASLTDRLKLDVKRHSRIYTDDFRTLLSIDDGAATTATAATRPNPTTDATNANVVSRSKTVTDEPIRREELFFSRWFSKKKRPEWSFHRPSLSLSSYHPQLQQQPQVQSMMQLPQQVHHLMPSSNASSTPNRGDHHHPSHQQQQQQQQQQHSHPPKEMNKPKGRMSAYTFFVQKCRDEHRKAYPNENANFSEFSKKCAEKWKVSEKCDLDID